MLPANTFTERVAIVTGGGSGIGRAIALELSRLGAMVALVGRRADKLEAAQAESKELRPKSDAMIFSLDVRDRDAVETMVQEVIARHGRIDHLVNAAAGNFRVEPENMSPNAWDSVIQIVQYGTWNLTQSVGRHMLDRGQGGSIVNIGSIMARHGGPDTLPSASAKAAVAAMTKSLAVAWGPRGIRVNLLIPGMTSGTPGMDILYGEDPPKDLIPLARMGTTAELAHAAAYLLSDYASYVTGTELLVDGGRALART